MTSLPPSSLKFPVRRFPPELVRPAVSTPRKVKILSDIDDQKSTRYNIPTIFIYRYEPSMKEKDPIKVLKHALSQTLVFYYPFAGRIKEVGDGRKLMVDCNGEGVIFVEAEADVTLDDFGDALYPPFPCFEQLLNDVPDAEKLNILRPIQCIQVTRLKCGGLILALGMNHAMTDGYGIQLFITAWEEMARGAREPSILPVWHRELLMARDPPRITCTHHEYDQTIFPPNMIQVEDKDHQSFLFTPAHVAELRRLVPDHLLQCTTFDLIAACLWHCRTKALQLDPEEKVRVMCAVNGRSRFSANRSSLVGYYGNLVLTPAIVTTAGKLSENSLGYAVELIRKIKAQVTKEYIHSVIDLIATKDISVISNIRSFTVSDTTNINIGWPNFGWGEALYGGVTKGGAKSSFGVTYIVPYKNSKGENGLLTPICLPSKYMKRFAKELDEMFSNKNHPTMIGSSVVKSTL